MSIILIKNQFQIAKASELSVPASSFSGQSSNGHILSLADFSFNHDINSGIAYQQYQTNSTIQVPDKPETEEDSLKTRLQDAMIDNVASMIIGALIGGIATTYFFVRNRMQRKMLRYHNQIAIETLEFRDEGEGPFLAFRKKPATEISDILDPAGVEIFENALKSAKKDSLSFIIFESHSKRIPHHLIGNPMAEWVEEQLSGSFIDLGAASKRLTDGLDHVESKRQISRFFGFFTCDKLGSVEQPRMVIVQKEDIINVILDLRSWWEATEKESRLEAADSKTNLGRILEFAVSLAIRHPTALRNSFASNNQQVEAALKRAEALKKILIISPEETTEWLEKFINSPAFTFEASVLPSEFSQSEYEWEEVLKDW